jgi:hypothetical protein
MVEVKHLLTEEICRISQEDLRKCVQQIAEDVEKNVEVGNYHRKN